MRRAESMLRIYMANKRGEVVEVRSPRLFTVALPAWVQVHRHRAIRYWSVTLQRLKSDAFRCLSVQTKVACVISPIQPGCEWASGTATTGSSSRPRTIHGCRACRVRVVLARPTTAMPST